jgi:hypothetical protein
MKKFLIGASGILVTVVIVATVVGMVIFSQQRERVSREGRALQDPFPTTVRNCHEVGQLIASAEARIEARDRLARENWLYTTYSNATVYINATVDSFRNDIKRTHASLDEERAAYRSRCGSPADDQKFVPPPNSRHFQAIAKH